MQLTIRTYDLSSSELELIEALIRLRKEKVLGYETASKASDCCSGVAPQPESNQPTLPFEGEIDTNVPIVNEVPVKKRTVKPKETPTSDEKPKEVSEPTQEVKTSSVSLQAVKELAQAMVAKHDRETVKAVINLYGEQLTKVNESDYQKLFDALNALND